jgi:hypothetical protein
MLRGVVLEAEAADTVCSRDTPVPTVGKARLVLVIARLFSVLTILVAAVTLEAPPASADYTVTVWSTDPDPAGAKAVYNQTTRVFRVCDVDGDRMSADGWIYFDGPGGAPRSVRLTDSNGADNSCQSATIRFEAGSGGNMKICRRDINGENVLRDCRESGWFSMD